ncbi:MAG: tetratricopeptide repeat protein, partial [Comamonadaceae bacterium]
MARLNLLRRLAEQQEFGALRDAAADADDLPTQVLLALALAQLGDRDAAQRLVDGIDASSLDLSARVDLSAAMLALGRTEAASALLEADLPAASDHGLLLARLAGCRLRQQRPDDALALFQRSAAAEPRVPVLLNIARLHQQAGLPRAALDAIETATTMLEGMQADHTQALVDHYRFQLATLRLESWLAADRQAEAEAWLEAVRERLPGDTWCALLLCHVHGLASRDRHAQGEELLRAALRRDPALSTLLGPLADLAFVQGRPAQAAAVVRRAIRLAEQEARDAFPLWTRLSATCVQRDLPAARQAAERALELAATLPSQAGQPDDQSTTRRMQAQLAMARVESHEGRHADAEARYRAVLGEHPDALTALADFGQLQLQLGRIDEAVALFERVSRQDPARGHSALISARRFPEDTATLEQLERHARTPGIEGSVRASLLLQLASAWEKRRDHERAFALADEGNAAARRNLPYDPAAHRQRCARIRHAFPRALYEHRRDVGVADTLPVFVLGMPRSGTTLVEQIIAGHSQVHGAGDDLL